MKCLNEIDVEIRNIIDIFNLDIKNIEEEIVNSLVSCIKKNHYIIC